MQIRTSGIDLIRDIRKIQPDIKVIVYSQESRPDKIDMLFQKLHINGYVCKSQHAIKELVHCIQGVHQNKIVLPPELKNRKANNVINLDNFDIILLEELAHGLTKKEIVQKLKKHKITPNSESTIDKRVSKLF